ncbi:hypothetical protein IKF57_02935 [Candidatus Saccharibacteria bacterium]|nr:hypothetical protein [Candidatus Saccharibacteria bacterium]
MNLKNLIDQTFDKYSKIERIWCPILKNYVYFRSDGRLHLIYKGNRKKRPASEQFYKLKLFDFAVEVIKNPKQLKSRRQINGIDYIAIVGAVDNEMVRVIVRKTKNGSYKYYSVMLENK